MKFTMLVGLPGSGKTHFGNGLGLPFFDDLTENGGLDALLNLSDDAVISDFGFLLETTRKAAVSKLLTQFPDSTFEWVVWENDPEACFKNIVRRNDGRNLSIDTLRVLSKLYTYPSTEEIRSVYDGN